MLFRSKPAYNYMKACLALPGNVPVCEGWIAFFYYTTPTTIGRIKLRKPETDESPDRSFRIVEDPYDANVGFFGLNMFAELRPHFGAMPAHVCEGDFDVLSTIAHQIHNGQNDIFIVGCGGSGENKFDELAEFGFEKIFLIPDNDNAGTGLIRDWLKNNSKVERVFEWTDEDTTKSIKDLDDAWRAYSYADFYKRLRNENSFQRNHAWAFQHASAELAEIEENDSKARMEKAVSYGQALQNEAERNTFIELMAQEYHMDRGMLVQDMTPDDTPEGLVNRLAKRLSESMDFVAKERSGPGTYILVYYHRTKRLESLPLHSHSMLCTALSSEIGTTSEYLKKEVGNPDFLNYKMGSRGREVEISHIEKADTINKYFKLAFEKNVDKIAMRSDLVEIGQGVHYLPDENNVPNTVCVLNGSSMFKGRINEDSDTIVYTQLDSPVSGKYLFNLSANPWSKYIRTAQDLNENDCDLVWVFHALKKIFSEGWRFKQQDLAPMFFAADMMYTTIAAVFSKMVMVSIQGGTHSGKSTLLNVMGGKAFPLYQCCEAGVAIDDYTAPGIRQFTTRNKLRLFLDEFEEHVIGGGSMSIDASGAKFRSVLNMFRNVASGSTSLRGNSDGRAREEFLNFPITIAGISTMQEARDVNRFIHFSLESRSGFKNPIHTLQKLFTPDDMDKIRKGVTLGLFPHLPKLVREYQKVRKEFVGHAKLPQGMLDRVAENLFPAATIMKLVGADYEKFVIDCSFAQMETMNERGGTQPEHEKIWSAILNTNIQLSQHSKELAGLASLSKMLSHSDYQLILSRTDLGAYWIPKRKWLVVFWQRLLNGILRYAPNYRNFTNYYQLKITADIDPRVIPRSRINNKFLKEEVWPLTGGTPVSVEDVSIIDLTSTIAQTQQADDYVEPAEKDSKIRKQVVEGVTPVVTKLPRQSTYDV